MHILLICVKLTYFIFNVTSHKSQIMICLSLNNSALGLWFFIRRGKQCLDFTVTVHFFHMIGCWVYNSHLPTSLSWWLVNVACVALMAVIGEYLCMRTELRAIPVNTGPKSNLWGTICAGILGLWPGWTSCRFQSLHYHWQYLTEVTWNIGLFLEIDKLRQWTKNAPGIGDV